jgi:hypothetical protein
MQEAFVQEKLELLRRSKFRGSFKLSDKDRAYLAVKGLATIRLHAAEFVRARLAPADPARDGKQTPFRGHPVFTAQHATATCCRTCMAKWHGVAVGQELTSDECELAVNLIAGWLDGQL